MLFRRFALGGHSARDLAAAAWGLATIVGLLTVSGCRTPWRAGGEQPDFNRLIEIERQQAGSRTSQADSLSARHRPGTQRSDSSQRGIAAYDSSYGEAASGDSAYGDEWSQSQDAAANRGEGKYASAKPGPVAGPGPSAAHGSLSDQDEMDEMLNDVPAAQRELLRREMTAMRAREAAGTAPDNRLSTDTASAANSSRASRRFSDDEPSGELSEDSPSYAGNSRYQLAANDPSRQDRADVAPHAVQAAATRGLSDTPASRASSAPAGQSAREPADGRAHAPAPARLAGSNPPPSDSQRDAVVSASYATPGQPASPATDDSAAAGSVAAGSIAAGSIAAGEQDLSWRDHIYRALEKLEQSPTAASPEEQVHSAMVDRLLHLSLGDINAASEPIDGLQTHGQDFIRHSLESLYEVTNPTGNPVEVKRYTLAMLSQRKALSHLAAVSNLEVQNATFCTEVDGFGVVTKFPQYSFKADQELLLYCELDNFVSTHNEGKGYETQLQGSYEIVDASGRRIADQLLPMDSHLCRNQRRDYFIAYRIYMPPKIEPGKYQLKLTVEDLKGRKFGQSALDFQIAQ